VILVLSPGLTCFWVSLNKFLLLAWPKQEGAKDLAENLFELFSENAVDDEVHRGIQGHLKVQILHLITSK
jgi:hypothetical protein